MEEKTIKDFQKELKKRERIEKLNKAKNFIINNKEIIGLGSSIVVGSVFKLTKFGIKRNTLKKEQKLKENYCYDRSLGHYWELKRKLSNKEWLQIENRKKNGESLATILKDLNVLKK